MTFKKESTKKILEIINRNDYASLDEILGEFIDSERSVFPIIESMMEHGMIEVMEGVFVIGDFFADEK